jgi:hypothetical protein
MTDPTTGPFRQLALAACLVSSFAAPPSAAQDAVHSGGVWGWKDYGQAECMSRGQQGLDAAASQLGIAARAQAGEGFHVDLLGDAAFQAAVLCIANDGSPNIVNGGSRVMVGVGVSTTRNVDLAAFRAVVMACIYDGNCAAPTTGSLAGTWTHLDWGTVILGGGPDRYTGSYSVTCPGASALGSIDVSRSAGDPSVFTGTWSDGVCRGTMVKAQLLPDGRLNLNYMNDDGPYKGIGGDTVLTRQ